VEVDKQQRFMRRQGVEGVLRFQTNHVENLTWDSSTPQRPRPRLSGRQTVGEAFENSTLPKGTETEMGQCLRFVVHESYQPICDESVADLTCGRPILLEQSSLCKALETWKLGNLETQSSTIVNNQMPDGRDLDDFCGSVDQNRPPSTPTVAVLLFVQPTASLEIDKGTNLVGPIHNIVHEPPRTKRQKGRKGSKRLDGSAARRAENS
jgi:hypothetical protein